MITYKTGDIWDTNADYIIIPVNCKGAAGKGLALEAKNRFPHWYIAYREWYDTGAIKIGVVRCATFPTKNGSGLICFPTKDHWRDPSTLEYIEEGLKDFVDFIKGTSHSFAFPKLGCGPQTGQLDWRDVKPLMEQYLQPLPNVVYVYE